MSEVFDLRSALELLKSHPGQLVETDVEADPNAEISGVYRHVGSGGTVQRPTREDGPAMVFNNVKGFPDSKVAIGVLSSRKRVGLLLDTDYKRLGWHLRDAVKNPIKPVIKEGAAPCQENIYRAEDPDFDLRKLVPAPTNTPEDAGPYITMGLCSASDPEGNGDSDVTIHRLCIQNRDEMTMWITPGSRHIGVFWDKALKMNKPLPISVSIGLDPAIYMSAGFEPPTTPLGFNELQIAGALRGKAVELAKCVSIDETCIAHAEYVIEGELIPGRTMREDINSNTGKAMPEFPGYTGDAKGDDLPNYLPVIKVKAVTTRNNPIMESCIGPSHEHVSMAGIPTEASVIDLVERAMPGRLVNVHAAPCGGGKFVTIIQFRKNNINDEGRQRQAALLAFSAFSEMKHVFLVDEDVDIFDMSDVMWAMTTRFQGDVDFIPIPGVHTHVLDPSNDPAFDPSIRVHGIACKAIFDCTVPYNLKDKFERCKFLDVDPKKWLPDMF
ncbi:UbiD family decarboxylase [Lachnospiraceae bacterium C1.1]|nr:UbiD family decarboxylase [Lachnospiraceae bacterium C1.1]